MERIPNILLIMADQLRWDALGCTGSWVETPYLDQVAEEGILFSNTFTTSPVCIPARVSMATGLYPHNNGVWKNIEYTLPPEVETWMNVIRDRGYHTAVFGKTHLHPHQGDLRDREEVIRACGFEDVDEIGGPRASARVLSNMTEQWQKKGVWERYRRDYSARFKNKPHIVRPSVLDLEDYADVYVGQQARRYLEEYDRDQPWFLWVSFGGPHEPWDAPEPYAGRYDPAEMPPPVKRPEMRGKRHRGHLDRQLGEGRRSPGFEPGDIGRMRANYAGNVTLIDEQIGQILNVIEQRCELDQTVISFTADHGELNGDYGLIYKENFLNGAVRVPLIIRTPSTAGGKMGGKVSETPVEWFDLGPTLVELAGGKIEYRQFARSLVPVLEEPGCVHRRSAVSEIHGEIMIYDGRYKMVLNSEGKPYLLFDSEKDPKEEKNLAGSPEMRDIELELTACITERLLSSCPGQVLSRYRGS